MRIAVSSSGLVLTKALKVDVRRRVLLAMSRFGQEVQGVSVRLAASRNPLGGVDQCCRARARLRSGPVLHTEAINGTLEIAVRRSADRLARLVDVELDGHGRPATTPAARPRGSDE